MRSFVLLMVIALGSEVFAQLSDDFEREAFPGSQMWVGDTADFMIVDGRLRSNSSTANHGFSIRHPVGKAWQEWEMDVELNLKTSSRNYVIFSLFPRDRSEPTLSVHIGGTKDRIELRSIQDGILQHQLLGSPGTTENAHWVIRTRWIKDSLRIQFRRNDEPYWRTLGSIPFQSSECELFEWSIQQSTSSFHKRHFLDHVYVGPARPDLRAPKLSGFSIRADSLYLSFNEPIMPGSASLQLNGKNVYPRWLEPAGLAIPLEEAGSGDHVLDIRSISDTALNTLDTVVQFPYTYFHAPSIQDLRFNELMFEPVSSMPEFIELVNTGRRPVRLDGLQIIRISGDRVDTTNFPQGSTCLAGSYLLVCTDTQRLCGTLDCGEGNRIQMTLPSLLNEGATLKLANDSFDLDSMVYSPDMHHPLLERTRGVSLEKREPSLNSYDRYHWGSATRPAGFCTPGRPNSNLQSSQDIMEFQLKSPWISPNGDGIDDDLCLLLDHPWKDGVLSAYIFTSNGVFVKQLERSLIPGQALSICWDITFSGGIAHAGSYILLITGFDLSGNTFKKKLPFHVDSHY